MDIEGDIQKVEVEVRDVMRVASRMLSNAELATIGEIKQLGNELHAKIDAVGSGREISLAKTKLEEAIMWASKAISA